jgi:hypothetical protein
MRRKYAVKDRKVRLVPTYESKTVPVSMVWFECGFRFHNLDRAFATWVSRRRGVLSL